ncbi:MAG: hypothetical protein ABI640_06975 [Gammaproteobacteria bacterium]
MSAAFDVIMRIVYNLLGLLMILMGCGWMMQGLNVGPSWLLQGFMVSDIHWTYYGAILAVVGIAAVIWSNTRRRAR